jgi:hypothetical protein
MERETDNFLLKYFLYFIQIHFNFLRWQHFPHVYTEVNLHLRTEMSLKFQAVEIIFVEL